MSRDTVLDMMIKGEDAEFLKLPKVFPRDASFLSL